MSNTGPKSRLTDATEPAIRVEMSASPGNPEVIPQCPESLIFGKFAEETELDRRQRMLACYFDVW